MANDPKIAIEVRAKVDELAADFAAATSHFNGFQGIVTSGFETLAKSATALTVALGGGHLFEEMVKEAVDWNTQITKIAANLGMSTQEASAYKSALDHLGIDQEAVSTAMQKMVKTATSSPEVFKKLRIDITDTNGELLSTSEIFSNVRNRLEEYESGSSRAGAASLIFGKGIKNLAALMKLSSDEFENGADRITKLGIVVTEEGSKKAIQYKEDMNDLHEVFGAIKTQIGMELIPQLSKLGKTFVEAGEHNMGSFQSGLLNIEIGTYKLAQGFDFLGYHATKVIAALHGGTFTSIGQQWNATAEGFSNRWKDNSGEITKLYNRLAGKNEDGSDPKPYKPQPGSDKKLNPKDVKTQKSDWSAYEAKYAEYVKAFEERKAAEIKIANEKELELNQEKYAQGLISEKAYLEEKNSLTLSSLVAEVKAKETELIAAQSVLKNLKTPTDSKGRNLDDKAAVARAEALKKEEQAQKAFAEAKGKYVLETIKGAEQLWLAGESERKQYIELGIQLTDLAGDYETAAKARIAYEQSTREYKITKAAADGGDVTAQGIIDEKAALDQQAVAAAAAKRAAEDRASEFNLRDIQNSTYGAWGAPNKLKILTDSYEKEKTALEAHISEMESLGQEWTDKYQIEIESRAKIDEKYQADKDKLEKTAWDKAVDAVGNSTETIGNIMMKGNKEQFEAGKKMAIASAMIKTYQGAANAIEAGTETGGVAGVVIGIAMGAAAIAAGMAQVSQIQSQTYQPKAFGGIVNAGSPYLVGEQGPELMIPGANGTIIPNNKLGGGSIISPTIVNQFSTGVTDSARAEFIRLSPMLIEASVQAVKTAMRNGEFQ